MHSFKDSKGRAWTFSIHVSAVKRVRAVAGVDLYGLVDDGFKGLAELTADPVRLVDVMWVLCEEEARKLGVSDEDFGAAMAGDALGNAAEAFVAELIDFFPNPRARAGLKQVVEKGRRVQELMADAAEAKLATIDEVAEADKLIASFGSAPASSASTPDPSPSAS
jgi:hypothetical protein